MAERVLTYVGVMVGCGAVGMGVGAFAASLVGLGRAYARRPRLSDGHEMPLPGKGRDPSGVMAQSSDVAQEVVVIPYSSDVASAPQGARGPDVGSFSRRVYGIVFDLDGTLVESVEIWFALLNGAAGEFGMPEITREMYADCFGQPMEDNLTKFFVGADHDAVRAYCDAHYGDYVQDHLVLLDGAVEAVESAVALFGPRVGLATNCPSAITRLILTTTGLDAYFPLVVCAGDPVPDSSSEVTVLLSPRSQAEVDTKEPSFPAVNPAAAERVLAAKPATDILDYSAAQLGLDPSELIFVGDSRFDVIAGIAADCVVVGIGVDGGFVRVSSIAQAHSWWTSLPRSQ